MKTFRYLLLGLAYAVVLGLLYIHVVPRIEARAKHLTFNYLIKNLAHDKNALLKNQSFHLGIYRPELPYHFDKVFEVEDSLGVSLSIISYYQAWGEGPEHELNREILENIHRGGYTPMITWEPWVSAFPQYRGIVPDSSLTFISQGEFDDYIRRWAREATRYGKPMLVRYAHEFSNHWYGWSSTRGNDSAAFIDAWRHVHDIFQEEGARNVAFVWNPFLPQDTAYYPGAEYVDWVTLDIFNFGPIVEDGYWLDFFTLARTLYNPMRQFDKPILIAETGSVPAGGNKNHWYRDMFHSLAQGDFPLVKGLVLFDTPLAKAPNGMDVDLSMTSDDEVYAAIKEHPSMEKLGLRPVKRRD